MSAANRLWPWLGGLLLAAGCGYHSGLELEDSQASVGIEIFANDSESRLVTDLERDLHTAMTRAVARLVHAPIVAPEKADLVLRGRIVDYRRRSGIRDDDNVLLETGIRVEVEGELWNPSGKRLASAAYANHAGYVLSDPDGELGAQERVLANVAERLVLDLFASVAYER